MWSLIYLVISIFKWCQTGWISVYAFIDFFIAFFRSSSYYHLWYLLELIYATVFTYFLMSFLKKYILYFVAVFLYIIGMFSYSYYWIDFSLFENITAITNIFPAMWDSITRAFPLLLLGAFSINRKKIKNNKYNLFLFVLSFILLCVEFSLINSFTNNHSAFSYIIFTIPCVYFFFNFVKNLKLNINKDTSKKFRNMSTIIYCVHPAIIEIFSYIKSFDELNNLLQYLCIAIMSTILSYIIVKLVDKRNNKILKLLY